MKFHKPASDAIARERLRMMVESGTVECSSEQMTQMKKEISEIISRYIEVMPEDFEIKILLKQKQKRA